MKWIGQSIVDFIARFRSDVYLDSPTAGGSDPDKFLGIDSNNKIIYRTGAEVFSDIGAASGDITGVDITGGTNLTVASETGTTSGDYSCTLNVDDAFLVNDGSDTTTGTITAGGFTTTGTWTFDEATSGTVGITTVQDSGTSFADNDTSFMTAAAIDDRILDYSYTTNTGDITAVVAGTGLSGGATSGSATLNVSGLTVSELAGATLITESESIAGNDNDTTLPTSAAVKLYADRPSQQIVLMRAGFKDDLGTDKHYVPLQSELEQTLYQHEMNGFVAPYNGKLLKLMYRGSGNYSGGDVAFTLEQIDRNEAFLTTPDVLETITVTGPTNTTTDPNMVTANFVSGSGTNAFVAGDHVLIGMQFDTDVTASGSKHFITLVFEFDFSGVAQ